MLKQLDQEVPHTGEHDAGRHDRGYTWASPFPYLGIPTSEGGHSGGGGDCDCDDIRFDTFVVRAVPKLESEPRVGLHAHRGLAPTLPK